MPLGDAEHPISFSFAAEMGSEHVEVTVRSGIAESRALAGTLRLRRNEWEALCGILNEGNEDLCGVAYYPVGYVVRGAEPVHLDDPSVVIYTDEDKER